MTFQTRRTTQRIPPSAAGPAAPTQRQMTITVVSVAVGMRRLVPRCYPLQGWDGDSVLGLGTRSTSRAGVHEYFVGVDPPSIVLPLPSAEMTTLRVSLVARTDRLKMQRQTFPLQGWRGESTRGLGINTTSRGGATSPLLGLRPPQVVLPLPSQRMQTVTAWSVARPDRLTQERRRPPRGWRGESTRGLGVNTTSRAGAISQLIGPRPPSIVLPLPSLRMMTLISWNVTDHDRMKMRQTFPLQGWRGESTRGLGPNTTSRAGAISKLVGPHPPQIVLPLPSLQMMTITTRLVAVRTATEMVRHRPTSELRPPTVITIPTFPPTTVVIDTALQAVARAVQSARRQPHWDLFPPQVLAQPPPAFIATPIEVTLAGRTRAEARQRTTRYELQPPATLEPAAVALRERTIRVSLAPSPRQARSPHYRLNAPIFRPTTGTVDVWLAGRTRLEAQRRAPHYELLPPATLEPESVAIRERTISVTLTAVRRRTETQRASVYALGDPVVILPLPTQQMQTITVALAGRTRLEDSRRRAPDSTLGKPQKILPLPTLREQTIKTWLVAVRTRTETPRRAPDYRLVPPIFRPQTGTIDVTLSVRTRIEAQRRAPDYRLSPPVVVTTPFVAVAPPISVTLAGRTRAELQRRASHYDLAPPATLEPESVALRERTISVTLVAGRTRTEMVRRAPDYRLTYVTYPAKGTVDVWLAGRTRIEAQRRAPRYFLEPPTKILPLPTLQMQTVQATDVAVRTRTEQPRHASHWELSPPTVIFPAAQPSLRVQTITTCLVAVSTRTSLVRRGPDYRLAPPTKILPLPTLREQTIKRTLVAVRTAVEQPRHAPKSDLFPGIVEPKLRLPDRRLRILTWLVAVPRRLEEQARRSHWDLAAPATLEPASIQLAERTIRVVLAGRTRLEWGRHDVQYRLSPPTAQKLIPTAQQQTITVTTVAVRSRADLVRREPRYFLSPPATLEPAAVALHEREITVSLAAHPKQPRAAHWKLRVPVVVKPVPTERDRTVTVVLAVEATVASMRRREPMWFLRPPTVLRPRPTLAQATIRVVLGAVRRATEHVRHFSRWSLTPPTTLSGAPIETVVKTYYGVAIKTREDMGRRASHAHLEPPTVIREIAFVSWKITPDTNWVLEPAAKNEWRVDPEPISGWTMEGSTP